MHLTLPRFNNTRKVAESGLSRKTTYCCISRTQRTEHANQLDVFFSIAKNMEVLNNKDAIHEYLLNLHACLKLNDQFLGLLREPEKAHHIHP